METSARWRHQDQAWTDTDAVTYFSFVKLTVMYLMGGATVLKVGGQFCEQSEPKKIFDPHFLASGGGQNIA